MRIRTLTRVLGPGILFASTAIGVSHLVQSTRAGADYGFGLLIVVILANLLKYPFFEFGSRYANVANESLIDGYFRIGKWMFVIYMILTVITMFFVTAAVGAVTGGFLTNLFGLTTIWGIAAHQIVTPTLFVICCFILLKGQYRGLDRIIKLIGSILVISTLITLVVVLVRGPQHALPTFALPNVFDGPGGFSFVIALMGWMPTAVDLSTWNSLWTVERIKDSGYRPTLRETLTEFNIGYVVSAILAVVFLVLGAYLLYGSGETLPDSATGFSHRLLTLYADVMGSWSYTVIAIAAFSIMFGTIIAIFDGYARSALRCVELVTNHKKERANKRSQRWYQVVVIITAIGAYGLILILGSGLKALIDIAMVLSFLIAPIIAGANFYLVSGRHSHPAGRPKWPMITLSWLGLIFLTAFALVYLVKVWQ